MARTIIITMISSLSTTAAVSSWITPLPVVPHLVLTASEVRPCVIVVGDIHGCLHELQDLLMLCRYDPLDHTLVLLGDYVNKGLYSAEVIKYVRSLTGAYCIRGNHDDAMLSYALNLNASMQRPTSYDYIDKLDSDDFKWLAQLPYTISIPSLDMLCVHAGLVPDTPLEQQTQINMVTMRNLVERDSANSLGSDGSSGRWEATARKDAGVPWASLWGRSAVESAPPPHVFFGHDAKRGLQRYEHATGLDTGCCYGKKLTAIVLPSRDIVQIDARMMYAEPKSKD